MNATQSIYHTPSLAYKVASYVVGKPLWWAMEQLSIVGGEEATIKNDSSLWKKVSGPYVSLDNLEAAADAVLEHWRNNRSSSLSDSLHNQETFTTLYSKIALPDVSLTSSDVKVLIKYLERDRQAIVTEREVIKLVDDESESTVTAVDHGVLEMKVAISNLQAQIDDIHSRIAQRTSQITENLRAKRKEIALSFLRSRKQLEELLLKRLGALENIQSTLDRIEQAAGDIEIMKVYSTSSETLKALLSHPSLQLPHIESTLSSLAETNAQQQEINEAIQIGGQVAMDASGLEIDEDELQGELESLVQEQREEEEKEKALKALEERVKAQDRVKTPPAADLPDQEAMVGEQGGQDPKQHDEEWERRWDAAQREKEVQKARDNEEETRRRARWAEEDSKKLAAEN
ncbi:hypothetical protein SISNIDRAFT_457037 [Sistotremastrum niveocremeum HHB9708]|uniref:Snf7-domain-containing protein n=1 Tax=Sistotremastrum niveocremeum HHB9708 TaxID=1314777 RepID=A0A164S0Z3_9AGAM|nr:hypothetical protein SISNIDRAFT_457037 [Sistotremastrum niveocremeum HHB9708]